MLHRWTLGSDLRCCMARFCFAVFSMANLMMSRQSFSDCVVKLFSSMSEICSRFLLTSKAPGARPAQTAHKQSANAKCASCRAQPVQSCRPSWLPPSSTLGAARSAARSFACLSCGKGASKHTSSTTPDIKHAAGNMHGPVNLTSLHNSNSKRCSADVGWT